MVALITSVVPGRTTVVAASSALAIVPSPSIPTSAASAIDALIAVSLRSLLTSHRLGRGGAHRPDASHPRVKDRRGSHQNR